MKSDKPEKTAYSSVHKALTLLEAFIPDNEEKSALEISKVVGIHKSTTTRLLATLRDRGYLDQNPSSKKFTLGFKIKELYQSFENSFHCRLVDRATPHMDELRDRLQESIVLSIPSDDGALISHISEGTGPLRLKANIGMVIPYSIGADGKVLLAFSPPDVQNRILSVELPKRTPHSLTDPLKLKTVLSNIVKRGYAVDREENNIGIQAVGVPISDKGGEVVAALVVAGSSYTVREDIMENLVDSLKESAEKISSSI